MTPIRKPRILIPKENIDYTKWSVIACDQFTSQPDYWNNLAKEIGDSPSTLKLIFPEAFMRGANEADVIREINQNMMLYLQHEYFREVNDYILTVRTTAYANWRVGFLCELDLEAYDPFGALQVRATEKTVKERLPLRMRIRRDAALELPHIMVLMDDSQKSVIEPLYSDFSQLEPLYSFTLNSNGGTLDGYRVKNPEFLDSRLRELWQSRSEKNCGYAPFVLAVGDGNHSLAAAHECWVELKKTLTPEQAAVHPARYALVEVVNLFDGGIQFEPIHRVVHGAGADFVKKLSNSSAGNEIEVYENGKRKSVRIAGEPPEIIAYVQTYIDEYIASHSGVTQDYVHGKENALGVSADGIAILLPAIDKNGLCKYIAENGVLTRKSFSMGEAQEKRYYFECRKIK